MRHAAAALLLLACAPAAAGTVVRAPYGVTQDGQQVEQFTLRNDRGAEVRVIEYGAVLTDVIVPDAKGQRGNVVLGFATLAEYEAKNANYDFGAVVGRYVGRIANARFTLDGREVRLTPNDGPNALHGGPGGFDKRVWQGRPLSNRSIALDYVSPAGEQGFPGTLTVRVTYTLGNDNSLRIDYQARTDAPTVLNLTNHSYFNLAGAGSGSVGNHLLQIDSDRLVETDGGGIPTGNFLPVSATPFDFRRPAAIASALEASHPQLDGRRGLNHGWLLGRGGRLRRAALLTEPVSGRQMEVRTTEPSLHIYTGNWFSGEDKGAQGTPYRPHDGIALETQHLPDSPNRPGFLPTVLRPGEVFRSTTIYRFSARETPSKQGK